MITQSDIVYMIVTDRFADGDPTNNGEVDRTRLDRRHGGDLLGIVQRMPYLQELGVTALWITPVYPNPPDSYHGYHPLDFETVDPHLCSLQLGPRGSREVIHRFVHMAHEHGLKVILDVVINHTAPNHRWLTERPDWYNWSGRDAWLWGLPGLDHHNVAVNDYFVQNVLEWIVSTGVLGVRIDAARHVDTEFWNLFKLFAQGLHPDVTLIGEVWDNDVATVAPYQAYHGFNSMFDFPLYFAIVDVFARDQSFGRIARPELSDDEPWGVLNRDPSYRSAHQLLTFIGNHDLPRFFHLAGGAERPEEALIRMKLALTFLFTTRGIPQLYYGDELAMDGGPHPDNRRDMPWAWIEEPETRSLETVRARGMFHFTHQLMRLRRASRGLRYGALVTMYVTPTLYAFLRAYPRDSRLVVLNNSWDAADVTIPIQANPRLPRLTAPELREGAQLFNELNPEDRTEIRGGVVHVLVPGKTGAIYRPPVAEPPPRL